MTRCAAAFLALLAFAAPARAADYDNFIAVNGAGLRPFAKDIGGLLGAASNHTARSLGFSGFDMGFRSAIQLKPSSGNNVLPSERAFGFNYFQAEIGMPYRIDGFVRAGGDDGLVVSAAGLRYGLRAISDQPYYMHAMLEAFGSLAAHKHFYARHFGANLRLSMNLKFAALYAGAGLDNTVLTVQNASDAGLVGKNVNTAEPRWFAGLKKKVRYGYFSAGYAEAHGRGIVEGALGLRF
ncbi:MAG: hypothetical protein FD189_1334 [Elusimicrobia bacterium]|nr:MAG: hypothetical protein FD154_765 [Elusimicrobiota bacterium]KAF0155631.1 MAG: hypothetical protein FD189_1334 [Elusimicrobiota bacterium]